MGCKVHAHRRPAPPPSFIGGSRGCHSEKDLRLAVEHVFKTNAKGVEASKRALEKRLEKATDPDVPEELLDLGVLSAARIVVSDRE